ncbi:MAG TPA: double-strand break repair helicase AddA [Alphaproteobacteria bacterium]|nr:double-strand break repair helicase AddA [Alphaproteobacteria bacterium]
MTATIDPNEIQRKASDPTASAWVAASAGSGKTKVLSDRVLNLLLAGAKPERILCLTFTRTAAAEMYNRIAARLAKWATASDADLDKELTALGANTAKKETARRLFAELLDTAGGLKILTLHSFCQSLLKRFPLEAGVSPQFDVLDEPSAAKLIADAQESVLSNPDFADVLQTVTLTTNEQGFLDSMKELAVRLPRLRAFAETHPTAASARLAYEQAFDLPENATEDSLINDFCTLSETREADLRQAALILGRGKGATDIKNAAIIADFVIGRAVLDTYLNVFLTKTGEPRKALAHKDTAAADPMLQTEALRAAKLKQRLRSVASMRVSLALLQIGAAITQKYAGLKAARAVLDYDDLIAAALDLLEKSGAAAWVLFKLDGGIDHILIDEAQDTSPLQWRIVKALADEFFAGETANKAHRTLFAVGDQKQSIFSFQGAVPEEFEKMHRFFKDKVLNAEQRWNDVPMTISFRSSPAVIEAVNDVLKNPLAADGVIDGNGDATHIAWRKQAGGLVEIWDVEQPEQGDAQAVYTKPVETRKTESSPMARTAAKIAAKIADMIQSKERLPSGKPITAGDILVLVRRRNSFIDCLTRELKSRNVPVSGADRLKITSHIAVKDLMVLGDFLLMPQDDLALATVLRSPLCGISPDDLPEADRALPDLDGVSENDLFALAYGRGRQSLFDRLKAYADKPETPLGKAYAFLSDLLNRVDTMRPFELYAHVLGRLGRQKAFVRRLGVQALDALEEFMNLALDYDRANTPSLQLFLRDLRANDVEIKRDPEQTLDAVRIMTVHASKGLEAPIVFLPDTRQKKFFAPKTVWLENGAPVWIPKADLRNAEAAAEIEKLKAADAREYRRLLYVALTRAADRLYVTGWDNKKTPENNWYDLIADSLPSKTLFVPAEAAQTAETAKEAKTASPLPNWAFKTTPPAEPTPPKPLVPSKPEGEEAVYASPLSENRLQARKRGTFIHKLLEILPSYPPEKRKTAAEKFLSLNPMEDGETAVEKVLSVLANPEFFPLFAPNALAEVPVSGIVGDRVVSGQIDRLAVSETEVLIVDYKSNRAIPDGIEKTPAQYVEQMRAYKSVLARIYPAKKIRCFLLWTEAAKVADITSLVE